YMIQKLAEAAERQMPTALNLLRSIVEIESPSDSKEAVDRCVAFVSENCSTLGGRVRLHRQKVFGDLLEARFGPQRSRHQPVLLLGHLDTVWPLGALKGMPFSVADGRVCGPGVLDMKAGVVMAMTAIAILHEQKKLTRPVIMLLNSDEEVGSN